MQSAGAAISSRWAHSGRAVFPHSNQAVEETTRDRFTYARRSGRHGEEKPYTNNYRTANALGHYVLHAFAVMPNHVHIWLVGPLLPCSKLTNR